MLITLAAVASEKQPRNFYTVIKLNVRGKFLNGRPRMLTWAVFVVANLVVKHCLSIRQCEHRECEHFLSYSKCCKCPPPASPHAFNLFLSLIGHAENCPYIHQCDFQFRNCIWLWMKLSKSFVHTSCIILHT